MERMMTHVALYFVYGLTDPRLHGVAAVRYIGVTMHPNIRYQAHLACPASDPVEKNTWVQEMQAAGYEPGIEIFEVFQASKGDRDITLSRETQWILRYINLGASLLNIHKNMVPGRKTVTVELVPGTYVKPFFSDTIANGMDTLPGTEKVLEDGLVIREIDWNDLCNLFLRLGAIGTF